MGTNTIEKASYTVGVISDTHGLLRPEVLNIFENVDLILHAGDIGGPDILDALQQVAPVTAVRGNMDYGTWAGNLPETIKVRLGKSCLLLVHDLLGLHFAGAGNGIQAVISGHTHRPLVERRRDVLFLNPGSAGHRRQFKPVSVGLLNISDRLLDAQIVLLDD